MSHLFSTWAKFSKKLAFLNPHLLAIIKNTVAVKKCPYYQVFIIQISPSLIQLIKNKLLKFYFNHGSSVLKGITAKSILLKQGTYLLLICFPEVI